MGETTHISWCDRTWSPWIGCTKVSPACDGCYAAHLMDTRLGRVEWGPHGERKRTSATYWRQLRTWNRQAEKLGRKISVFPSLCDPFDNQADPGVRREWFDEMRATPHLLHLLLTKRPQNIVRMAEEAGGLPPNAALGTTCEDQKRADMNEPALVNAAAEVDPVFTFLSCEPLLGPIRLRHLYPIGEDGVVETPRIDWVITGGETDQGGHRARPTHPDWFQSLRDQCAAAGVPFHHKQNGEWVPSAGNAGWLAFMRPDGSHGGFCEPETQEMSRIGKRASGRLLDGFEHNGMPEVAR